MRWVAFMVLCAFACGQSPKNYKDHGEYDLYNEVAKDFAANNSSKALTDLEDIPPDLYALSAKVAPAWTASVTTPRRR